MIAPSWKLSTDRRWPVIYSDPPWEFMTRSAKGKGRSASAWYDCTSLEEIKRFPVAELAEPDSVLLMWVPDPFHTHAHEVLTAWRFDFRTIGLYWVKTRRDRRPDQSTPRLLDPLRDFPIGCGYYTRANPEQCWLAVRGRGLKRLDAGVPKLIVAPRREHSRKPDAAYERIERLYSGPYLELFARQRRPGWDAIGLEVDSGPASQRRWRSNSYPGAAP